MLTSVGEGPCFSAVDEPPVARGVPAGLCRVDEQRGEPLHPPVHAYVINHDTRSASSSSTSQ